MGGKRNKEKVAMSLLRRDVIPAKSVSQNSITDELKLSNGANALGANFRANRKHNEVGSSLYKHCVPLFLIDCIKSSVMFSAPYIAG